MIYYDAEIMNLKYPEDGSIKLKLIGKNQAEVYNYIAAALKDNNEQLSDYSIKIEEAISEKEFKKVLKNS